MIAAALSVAHVAAQKSVFVSFDAPDAGQITFPISINQGGDITGYYTNSVGEFGFVRLASGKLIEFSAPVFLTIIPMSINRSGQITGQGGYCPSGICGFLRSPNGKLIAVNVPGALILFLTPLTTMAKSPVHTMTPPALPTDFYVTPMASIPSSTIPMLARVSTRAPFHQPSMPTSKRPDTILTPTAFTTASFAMRLETSHPSTLPVRPSSCGPTLSTQKVW